MRFRLFSVVSLALSLSALVAGPSRATLIDGQYTINLFGISGGAGSFDVVGAAVQNLSYTFSAG